MTYPPGQNPYGQNPYGAQQSYGGVPYGAAGGYTNPRQNTTDTFGLIGLILGIGGILLNCCGCFTIAVTAGFGLVLAVLVNLAAFVLGIVGVQKAKKEQRSAGMSIAAIVLGGIGLLVSVSAVVAFFALGLTILSQSSIQ